MLLDASTAHATKCREFVISPICIVDERRLQYRVSQVIFIWVISITGRNKLQKEVPIVLELGLFWNAEYTG